MADKLHSIHLFYNFISILFVLSLLNVVADKKNYFACGGDQQSLSTYHSTCE